MEKIVQQQNKKHFNLGLIKQLQVLNNHARLPVVYFINLLKREMIRYEVSFDQTLFFQKAKLFIRTNSNFINHSQITNEEI